jgi:5S rRNA maturation endonuclease (ribonuclease M5)
LEMKTAENIEDILSELEIQYTKYPSRLSFSCPIHGSDNLESLSIYPNIAQGSYGKPNWKCWTKHCEETEGLGKDLYGLIGGILEKDRSAGIQWTKKYFNVGKLERSDNLEEKSNRNYIMAANIFDRQRKVKADGIPRQYVRKSLEIPSAYFVGRGFSREILDKYDVGFCSQKDRPMFNRAVVPIYDDDHKYMVACQGRTIFPQCYKCKTFHHVDKECPNSAEQAEEVKAKWLFSAGFSAASYLYNFWYAHPHILKTGNAILVEGAADIWRLEEAGIRCGLAMFGINLSEDQKLMLATSGAYNVIIATDNDDAGRKSCNKLTEELSRSYNVESVTLKEKDIGDTPIEDVKKLFSGVIK